MTRPTKENDYHLTGKMGNMKSQLILLVLLLVIISCNNSKQESSNIEFSNTELIADTIFYPVKIRNIDSTDKWADTRLRKLDRKRLVDEIFSSIYSGKATAYNYLSNKPYSKSEIEALEQREGFNRDNVVELEFREKWWYNPDNSGFKKEVLSILVAYVVFDEFGDASRLKAAFYIKMNN